MRESAGAARDAPAVDHRVTAASAADVRPADRVADPALLVIDMQNDFVRSGAPQEVAEARATIPVIAGLLEAFRRRGRPVAFTRFVVRPDDELMPLWSPQCGPATRSCWPGELRRYADADRPLAGIDVVPELAPRPGEGVIDKNGYGAFHDTWLDSWLRARGVRSLVIAGTVTQICVEETAREAFHHGYRTTVVTDAVSSFAPDLHAAALKNLAQKFAWVADSGTVLSWL